MPLYFNVKPYVIRVILADGRSFGFPPRQEVLVSQADISADIQALLNNNTLVYRGHTAEEQTADAQSVERGKRLPDSVVTSSDLQPECDNKIDRQDEDTGLDDREDSELADDGPKRRKRKIRVLGE